MTMCASISPNFPIFSSLNSQVLADDETSIFGYGKINPKQIFWEKCNYELLFMILWNIFYDNILYIIYLIILKVINVYII